MESRNKCFKKLTISHQGNANRSHSEIPCRIRRAIIKKTSVGENMGKLESPYTASRNVKLYSSFGKQSDGSSKVK